MNPFHPRYVALECTIYRVWGSGRDRIRVIPYLPYQTYQTDLTATAATNGCCRSSPW